MSEPKPMTDLQMKIIKSMTKLFSRFQASRYVKSRGKRMHSFGGYEICVVTMRGAKSGVTRHIPLMYVPHDDGVILVASMGGAPRHPTWYYNLLAHPDIEVQLKERILNLRARRATSEEKASLWPLCVERYPDYDLYQHRTERDIPVFICEPR